MKPTVMAFGRDVMSEQDYQHERDSIRATYGDGSSVQARAHADQSLAALFVRSGWTQERLAQIEGKSRPYITQRLAFGRFLAFVAIATMPEFGPIQQRLTEGKFRGYWARTAEAGNDRQRFLAVQGALIEDLRIEASRTRKHPKIPAAIKQLADGKWHHEETIVVHVQKVCRGEDPPVDVSTDDILAVLAGMCMHRTHGVVVDKRKGAKGWSYKLVRAGRQIDIDVLMVEAGPILAGLKAEGKKNMATMSPGTVAHLTFQLERLIDKLARMETPPRGSPPKE